MLCRVAYYGTIAEPHPNNPWAPTQCTFEANGLMSIDLDWTIAHPLMHASLQKTRPSSPVARVRASNQHVHGAAELSDDAGEEHQCGSRRATRKETHQTNQTGASDTQPSVSQGGLPAEPSAQDASSSRSRGTAAHEEATCGIQTSRAPVWC